MLDLVLTSFFETLLMVFGSVAIGLAIGFPFGIVLFCTRKGGVSECVWINQILNVIINSLKAIPYIILSVLMIPVTRFLVGTSIGTLATLVPLGLSSSIAIARMVEDTLDQLPVGLKELGITLGASHWQLLSKILLPECTSQLVSGITWVTVSMIGLSAMAGAVGGGGLGDLAIRYGYQRFNLEVLAGVVLILIALVQAVQVSGNQLSKHLKK